MKKNPIRAFSITNVHGSISEIIPVKKKEFILTFAEVKCGMWYWLPFLLEPRLHTDSQSKKFVFVARISFTWQYRQKDFFPSFGVRQCFASINVLALVWWTATRIVDGSEIENVFWVFHLSLRLSLFLSSLFGSLTALILLLSFVTGHACLFLADESAGWTWGSQSRIPRDVKILEGSSHHGNSDEVQRR